MKGYCGNCKKVIDETEIYYFKGKVVCIDCLPYLCQICRLNKTYQNNFDYECIEASDFLFKPKKMICITCGKNEAINDYYKECVGCIIKHEKESSLLKGLKTTKTFTTKDEALEELVKSKGYTLDDKDYNEVRG